MSHASGIRTVRRLEISPRPVGEAQERCCRATPEIVILRDEVERPPGVCHGVGHIAPNEGNSGMVNADPTSALLTKYLCDKMKVDILMSYEITFICSRIETARA